MANEKKGITVKIDAELHAEIRQFIEQNGMTMAEFVSQALYNELHPKIQPQEVKYMGPTRTMAFQMPEDMFQRLKDYLHRHNITQKEFVLGLVEAELKRDQEIRAETVNELNNTRDSENEEPDEDIDDEEDEELEEEDSEDEDEELDDEESEDEELDNEESEDEDEDLDDEESEDEDEELDDEESEDEDEELGDEESENEDEELGDEESENEEEELDDEESEDEDEEQNESESVSDEAFSMAM